MESLNEFVALVGEMRAAQRACGRHYNPKVADRRQELERMVDAATDEIIAQARYLPIVAAQEGK